MNTIPDTQMELSFTTQHRVAPAARRQHRLQRATWWFGQMRLAADRAFGWSVPSSARPEHLWQPGRRHAARA